MECDPKNVVHQSISQDFHDLWRQHFAEPAPPLSKFVDHIHAEKELISGISVVVSLSIPRVIEAKLPLFEARIQYTTPIRPETQGRIHWTMVSIDTFGSFFSAKR